MSFPETPSRGGVRKKEARTSERTNKAGAERIGVEARFPDHPLEASATFWLGLWETLLARDR